MNTKEITEMLQKIFHEYYWGDCIPNVEIKVSKPEHLLVELTCEYDPPTFTDSLVDSARVALGFTFAEKFYDISIGGCETCDWGSSYGFALRFWN